MPLVDLPFGATFTFARSIAADCRDTNGAVVTRAIDTPRFDHDDTGKATGLLVEAGPAFGQHDNIRVQSGDWALGDRFTVLHEVEIDGAVQFRALYSDNVRRSVDACLKIAGRHRTIAAVPVFLPNLGGFVRYRAIRYELGDAIGPAPGVAIGDNDDRPLIES